MVWLSAWMRWAVRTRSLPGSPRWRPWAVMSRSDCSSAPPVIDVGRVIGLELSVLGSHGMAAAEYPEMLDLVGDGRLRPQDLVTNVIGLEDAPAAMEMLGSSTGSGMTIIDLSR